jgi:hypothetical protein
LFCRQVAILQLGGFVKPVEPAAETLAGQRQLVLGADEAGLFAAEDHALVEHRVQQGELDQIAADPLRSLHPEVRIDDAIDFELLLDQIFGHVGPGIEQPGHIRFRDAEQKGPGTDLDHFEGRCPLRF